MPHAHSPSWKSPSIAALALAAVVAPLAFAAPAFAAPQDDVVINEVIQNHPTTPDSIELTNVGTAPIDVAGWILADNQDRDPAFALPAGSMIAPGGFLSVEVDVDGAEGFGLGRVDEARLLLPDRTQVDRFAWADHSATSYGRGPDGTGEFALTRDATPGAANSFAAPGQDSVVINEVESSQGAPGDWVELFNTGSGTVDLTGWVLRDDKDTAGYALPAGSTIAAGGYLVLDEADFGFGLGGADQARIFLPDGMTLVDGTAWTAHAATTWGRCANGVGAFAETNAASKGAENLCAEAAVPSVVINEIESNQGDPGDWVELLNTGTTAVDLSGWIVSDSDPLHISVVPAGTVLDPGAFHVVNEAQLGYGLGKADSARLLLADGLTVVDEHSWTDHSPTTLGRCPDGTGAFQDTTASTKGATNDCSAALRINEVESNGDAAGDWVEVVNVGALPIDASGMTLRDSGVDNQAVVLPAGTVVAAGAYFQIFTEPTFGLGGNDLARLIDVDGVTVLDETAWTGHAAVTWGRCPDGTGAFGVTREATPGAPNACAGDLITQAWPGAADVALADTANTFGADMSGVIFDPASTAGAAFAWAVNNGGGTLHRLVLTGDQVREAAGWEGGRQLRYPDGTGTVDAEAVALSGESGIVYIGSERNTGGGSSGSRPSVLRYAVDAATGELVAQQEWNLTADYPGIGANAGIEGLAWISDATLVAGGLADLNTGAAYDPTMYGAHSNGVFFVGVEATNMVAGYVLAVDGSMTRITEFATAFPGIMELEYEPATSTLWAYCDEACDGRSQLFSLTGGVFTAGDIVDRPAGMANIANEGFGFAPQAMCVGGAKPVIWADDAQTGGHAFRVGSIACTAGGVDGDGSAGGGAGDGTGFGASGDGAGSGASGSMLAATGSDGAVGLMLGALVGLLAGALLLVRRGAKV